MQRKEAQLPFSEEVLHQGGGWGDLHTIPEAQLRGIGGSRSIGFGAKRVTSLPDGLAHTFQEYLTEREERMEEQKLLDELRASHRKDPVIAAESEKKPFEPASSPMLKIGDICPECGQATVINEEGCRKCYSCGYSEC